MTEITQYQITIGNNTNVTATTNNLTTEQKKALLELQNMVPGDISISADGVVSITSQKGLALFNSFCQQNNILSSSDTLMQIDLPKGSSLPAEGLKSASAFCASFGGGKTDPSKMSFTELMTLMLMMSYASEEERRRVLSEAKSTQMQIALEVAVATWETSRDAAEKNYSAETLQAWGTIASGIVSAGAAIGSAVYSAKASPKQGKLSDNNKKLENDQLLKSQAELKDELELPDTNSQTIKTKQEEIKTQIQRKEAEIRNSQADVKAREEAIKSNEEGIQTYTEEHKAEIEQKNKEIEQKDKEISDKKTQIRAEPDPNKNKQLEAELEGLKSEKAKLKVEKDNLVKEKYELEAPINKVNEINERLRAENAKPEKELEELKGKEAKLEKLVEINKKIQEKGLDPHGDRLSKGEIQYLEYENKKLGAEVSQLESKSDALSKFGKAASDIIKGGLDLPAAFQKRQAAFSEADARLSDAWRGVVQSQIQGMDASINSANQNMQKIASTLKQVLDETYNIMTSIARNI
ncbi:MAG: hypothetical protein LBC11_00325 [Puniceicoccales bacterium]|jgi:hypothetical protein|nr:hypothetical protein [Puniceicoccales bacterium]